MLVRFGLRLLPWRRGYCAALVGLALITHCYAHAQPTAPRFETRVVAEQEGREREVQRVVMQGESLRTTPGALGDPLRIVGSLPGVTTPIAFLPWFAIRGASPGMSGYFIDGMQIPLLFHMLVGGGVIHAGLIEQLDFLPGAYDAAMGHFAGGVASAKTRAARSKGQHLEAEHRLFDASALVELALPSAVRISMAGHYGYPAPILRAIDDRIDLNFWDYQLRIDWRGLTVQALGSYDSLNLDTGAFGKSGFSQNMRTTFHRLQVVHRWQRGSLQAEVALVGGVDESGDTTGRGLRKVHGGARAKLSYQFRWLRLYAAIEGELSKFHADSFSLERVRSQSLESVEDRAPIREYTKDALGELGEERLGGVASAVLQARVDLWTRRVTLTAGTRVDLYHAGATTLLGIDPRVQLHFVANDWLSMHVGVGVYQQPPSPPMQLPGVDTFALKLGLQRAVHVALTEEMRLPGQSSLRLTGYYQQFVNATDVPPFMSRFCAAPAPEKLTGATATLIRIVDGQAYGMEVLLRKQAGPVSGWISYTLSRSERGFPCGLRPADYDQAHTLNIVVQVRLPGAVLAGARLYVASGRPETQVDPASPASTLRNNMRLPAYAQLDLRLERRWQFRRWALTVFLETLNTTFSTTVLSLKYPQISDATRLDYSKPSLDGLGWILPSVGLRGSF